MFFLWQEDPFLHRMGWKLFADVGAEELLFSVVDLRGNIFGSGDSVD